MKGDLLLHGVLILIAKGSCFSCAFPSRLLSDNPFIYRVTIFFSLVRPITSFAFLSSCPCGTINDVGNLLIILPLEPVLPTL